MTVGGDYIAHTATAWADILQKIWRERRGSRDNRRLLNGVCQQDQSIIRKISKSTVHHYVKTIRIRGHIMPMLKTNLIYSIAVIMITWRFNYG